MWLLVPLLLLTSYVSAQQRTVGILNTEDVDYVVVVMSNVPLENPPDVVGQVATEEDFTDPDSNQPLYPEVTNQAAFYMGQALRTRYPGLISTEPDGLEVERVSGRNAESLKTAQLVTAGLYAAPGEDYADAVAAQRQRNLPPPSNQPFLSFLPEQCAGLAKVGDSIKSDPSTFDRFTVGNDQLRGLLQYVIDSNNLIGTAEENIARIESIAQNIFATDVLNLEQPSWVQNSTLGGYDRRRIIDELFGFISAAEAACASTADCGILAGGAWLDYIRRLFTAAQLGLLGEPPNEKRKMTIFSGDATPVLSLTKLLGYIKPDKTLIPSAGLVLEFRRNVIATVRFVYHYPNPFDPRQRRFELARRDPACTIGGTVADWCPIGSLGLDFQGQTIRDQAAACDAEDLAAFIANSAISVSGLQQSGSERDSIAFSWDAQVGSLATLQGFQLTIFPLGLPDSPLKQTASAGPGARSFAFDSLQPGTTYQVFVQPLDGNGASVDLAQAEMNTAGVATVTGLSVSDQSTSSATVNWVQDGPLDQVQAYEISWSVVGEDGSSAQTARLDGNSATSFELTGLTAGTQYEVTVTPVTTFGSGEGASSTTFTTQTAAEAGLPSTASLDLVSRTPTSVNVQWGAGEPRDLISGWTITWTDDGGVEQSVSVGADVNTFTIDGLTPGTDYTVTVTPVTTSGQSGGPKSETFTTLSANFNNGDRFPAQGINVVEIGDSFVKLQVVPPTNPPGPITSWAVTLTPVGGGDPISLTTTDTTFTVDGLRPSTEYVVSVTSVSESAESEPFTITVNTIAEGEQPITPTGTDEEMSKGDGTNTGTSTTDQTDGGDPTDGGDSSTSTADGSGGSSTATDEATDTTGGDGDSSTDGNGMGGSGNTGGAGSDGSSTGTSTGTETTDGSTTDGNDGSKTDPTDGSMSDTSDGSTSDGSTSDGSTSEGSTSDGSTSDSSTSDGSTSESSTSDGSKSDGSTSDGSTSDGSTTDTTDGSSTGGTDGSTIDTTDVSSTDGGDGSTTDTTDGSTSDGNNGLGGSSTDITETTDQITGGSSESSDGSSTGTETTDQSTDGMTTGDGSTTNTDGTSTSTSDKGGYGNEIKPPAPPPAPPMPKPDYRGRAARKRVFRARTASKKDSARPQQRQGKPEPVPPQGLRRGLRPSNASSIPSAACSDGNEHCGGWARRGLCETKPMFMRPLCQSSCGSCGDTAAKVAGLEYKSDCFDSDTRCPHWAAKLWCYTSKYRAFLRQTCPASCRLCELR